MSPIVKNVGIPVVVLAIAALVSLAMVSSRAQLPKRERVADVPVVEVLSVNPGLVPVRLKSRGIVTPRRNIELVTEVSGKVIWVDPGFLQGEQIRADQLLIRIDPIDYEVALSEAKASLASAELSYAEATVLLKKAAILEAEALVQAAKDRVRQAQKNLENTAIRAPFDAVVDTKSVDLGQYVQVGQSMMTLLSTGTAEVRLPLLASDLPFVHYGQDAQGNWQGITLSATFGNTTHSWPARLARLEQRVDAETRVFFLVAQVDAPYDLSLHPRILAMGLFVETTFQGEAIPDATRLPRSAVHNGGFVYVVRDGKLSRQTVALLRAEGDSVIVGEGLHAGDQVVLSRLNLMVSGMPVRVAS